MGLYPFPFLPMVLWLRKRTCPRPKSFWVLFVVVVLGEGHGGMAVGVEEGVRSQKTVMSLFRQWAVQERVDSTRGSPYMGGWGPT
jgi:hypothetical protein